MSIMSGTLSTRYGTSTGWRLQWRPGCRRPTSQCLVCTTSLSVAGCVTRHKSHNIEVSFLLGGADRIPFSRVVEAVINTLDRIGSYMYYYNFDGTNSGFVLVTNAMRPRRRFSPSKRPLAYLSWTSCAALWTLAVSQVSLSPARLTITASGDMAATSSASATASATTAPGDAATRQKPASLASAADKTRPASTISDAICMPNVLTARGMPPAAAQSPLFASGSPNVADGEATTMSLRTVSKKKDLEGVVAAQPSMTRQDVPVEGDFEAAAQGEAVDGGNDGLLAQARGEAHEAAGGKGRGVGLVEGVLLLRLLLEVGAAAKGPGALAGDDGDAQLGLVVEPLPQPLALPVAGHGDGIHVRLAVDGDQQHMLRGEAELVKGQFGGL